jgi:hypothetical protein
MRSTVLFILPLALSIVVAACATGSPAARAPLRDKLAQADASAIIDASKDCLSKNGWKVDPVGSVSSTGADVVSATKEKEQVNVSIHGKDYKPRITDGPDNGDPFWKCLATALGGGGGGEAPAGSSSSEGAAEEPPAHS